MLGPLQQKQEEPLEQEETISIESVLTRELGIRFIDARQLTAEAKINLNIHGYPNKFQQRLVIIEAINLFHERSPRTRIEMQELKDSLDAYKDSTHSNASGTSHTAGSDAESSVGVGGRRRSIVRRRSSSAGGSSAGSFASNESSSQRKGNRLSRLFRRRSSTASAAEGSVGSFASHSSRGEQQQPARRVSHTGKIFGRKGSSAPATVPSEISFDSDLED